MRRLCIVLLFLFHSTFILAQKKNEQNVTSKIVKVTVFMQGAQVERTAQQRLSAGKLNIVFTGISPKIIEKSIQLKAEGKLSVLSVTHQINLLQEQEMREEIEVLKTQHDSLKNKLEMEKLMRNVYLQEEQMLVKNQDIKGENSTLKANELKDAIEFQRQRLTEVFQNRYTTEQRIEWLEKNIRTLIGQMDELNDKKDLSTSEIIVALDVNETHTASFRLTYLVTQASWHASYDVRVTDITKPIDLQMKANLSQQSGEDWKNVKLLLSTGNPNENGTRPTLVPWYLRYHYPMAGGIIIRGTKSIQGSASGLQVQQNFSTGNYSGRILDVHGSPIAGANVQIKGTNTGTTTRTDGSFNIMIPPGFNSTMTISAVGYTGVETSTSVRNPTIFMTPAENQLQEVVVNAYGGNPGAAQARKRREEIITTTTIYQPTTTIFEIDDPFSVPNDGKLYAVDINNFQVPAEYEYYAAPKVDANAYLTAKVIDWQELNLLPGEANLFFEGTFLGNSFLDVKNAGDTLNISLGMDKGVVVKRTLLKEYSSKKFLGSNKTDTRQYHITVRNNKSQPVRIIIEDQFPLSTNKDIEIEKLSYENGKLDDDTKIVTWAMNIEQKKETNIPIGFSVKYPRNKVLVLE